MLQTALSSASLDDFKSILRATFRQASTYRINDGRILFSAFNAELRTVSFWSQLISELSSEGVNAVFIPTFLNYAYYTSYASVCYGASFWGTSIPDYMAGKEQVITDAHALGLKYMFPINLPQYRPKSHITWEAQNSLTFRNCWMAAINGEADLVQIVTWNDYSESSQLSPYTDQYLGLAYGNGYYELNKYYAAWFKTGIEPEYIEKLFWFHRKQFSNSPHPNQANNTSFQSDPATDKIELVSLLNSPGTLSITINGTETTLDVRTGITSFMVDMDYGTPQYKLIRSGVTIIKGDSILIEDNPLGITDLTYWSGYLT